MSAKLTNYVTAYQQAEFGALRACTDRCEREGCTYLVARAGERLCHAHGWGAFEPAGRPLFDPAQLQAALDRGRAAPPVTVRVDSACDPESAYLLELTPGELTAVVHPSLPRDHYPAVLSALLTQRAEQRRRSQGAT